MSKLKQKYFPQRQYYLFLLIVPILLGPLIIFTIFFSTPSLIVWFWLLLGIFHFATNSYQFYRAYSVRNFPIVETDDEKLTVYNKYNEIEKVARWDTIVKCENHPLRGFYILTHGEEITLPTIALGKMNKESLIRKIEGQIEQNT